MQNLMEYDDYKFQSASKEDLKLGDKDTKKENKKLKVTLRPNTCLFMSRLPSLLSAIYNHAAGVVIPCKCTKLLLYSIHVRTTFSAVCHLLTQQGSFFLASVQSYYCFAFSVQFLLQLQSYSRSHSPLQEYNSSLVHLLGRMAPAA